MEERTVEVKKTISNVIFTSWKPPENIYQLQPKSSQCKTNLVRLLAVDPGIPGQMNNTRRQASRVYTQIGALKTHKRLYGE
jgi:hypothetical protein